jgi:hypothetical protein
MDGLVREYEKLIEAASDAQDPKAKAKARADDRVAYATMLHVLKDASEGLAAGEHGMTPACNRKQSASFRDNYWAKRREKLIDIKLVQATTSKPPVYSLTEDCQKFAAILKSDGHVNEAQLPDHDPTAGLTPVSA